ncbi:hypothetical protein SCHPADRAFT_880206 [Schizopora paradoxa]|uniref:AAA+ ATPase domain-containing protein n=1 Tax=Schizopora paradoxa TaxID=27342 RepID=A0A0H2RGU8_9AGAM|nr:hypothetical protein SCHPADRAFT_880206 [Schizopora paradoxa]
MNSFNVATRHISELARKPLENTMVATIHDFIRDLVVFLYSLICDSLHIGDLWIRLMKTDTKTPLKVDATTQVEEETVLDEAHVDDAKADKTSNASNEKRGRCSPVSALCRAIVQRDVDLVSRILVAAPFLASKGHRLGFNPLSVAILSGEPAIVRLILAQPGVDPDRSTSGTCDAVANKDVLLTEFSSDAKYERVREATALHYACMSGNPDVLKIICDVSNCFATKDSKDKTPIDFIDCSTEEGLDSLKIFSEALDVWLKKKTAFGKIKLENVADAIFKRDLDLVEKLLKQNPNIASAEDGWTLLHVAVLNQLPSFVEHIINVDPSCLNISAKYLHRCMSYLTNRGEPIYSVDGATALHLACLLGNLEIADILLKAGADWTIKDTTKRTAEDYIRNAHGTNHTNIFKRLCDEEDARRKAKSVSKDSPTPAPQDPSPTKEEDEVTPTKKDEPAKDATKAEEKPKKTPGSSGSSAPRSDSSDSSDTESDKPDEKVKKEDDTPRARALDLERIIGAKIIGQRGPVRSVASAIRLRENGWIDPDRPLVMLFLGSSGVGKTELAKQIALYIHGKSGTDLDAGQSITEMESEFKFVRIDMSEYQHKHTVSNLTGPPKGYVGYDEEGFLTRRLRKSPRAIVLLDEIEKAHPDVLTVFLQVFDDGRITDTKRGVIYCQNAVFIMTSNLASDEIKMASPMLRKLVERTEDRPEEYTRVVGDFNRSIHPILKQSLRRDEFLGRINQIVVFLPLNEEEISVVINKELTTWAKRAHEKHEIKLTWSSEVVKKLTKSYDVNFGVRSVAHEVQRIAVQQVAEAQIRGVLNKNYLAYLTTNELGDIELQSERRVGHIRGRNACRYPLHYM